MQRFGTILRYQIPQPLHFLASRCLKPPRQHLELLHLLVPGLVEAVPVLLDLAPHRAARAPNTNIHRCRVLTRNQRHRNRQVKDNVFHVYRTYLRSLATARPNARAASMSARAREARSTARHSRQRAAVTMAARRRDLEVLLGLRHRERGGTRSGVRVWRILEWRGVREEGEALVPSVLHLPDALLEGGGEVHRGGGRWQ
jgi:hypothetical protein